MTNLPGILGLDPKQIEQAMGTAAQFVESHAAWVERTQYYDMAVVGFDAQGERVLETEIGGYVLEPMHGFRGLVVKRTSPELNKAWATWGPDLQLIWSQLSDEPRGINEPIYF